MTNEEELKQGKMITDQQREDAKAMAAEIVVAVKKSAPKAPIKVGIYKEHPIYLATQTTGFPTFGTEGLLPAIEDIEEHVHTTKKGVLSPEDRPIILTLRQAKHVQENFAEAVGLAPLGPVLNAAGAQHRDFAERFFGKDAKNMAERAVNELLEAGLIARHNVDGIIEVLTSSLLGTQN